jgi:hypothetical protein
VFDQPTRNNHNRQAQEYPSQKQRWSVWSVKCRVAKTSLKLDTIFKRHLHVHDYSVAIHHGQVPLS